MVLVGGKQPCCEDHKDQHDPEIQVLGFLGFDHVYDKTQEGSNPKQSGKSRENMIHENLPSDKSARRSQCVGAISLEAATNFIITQSVDEICSISLLQFSVRQHVIINNIRQLESWISWLQFDVLWMDLSCGRLKAVWNLYIFIFVIINGDDCVDGIIRRPHGRIWVGADLALIVRLRNAFICRRDRRRFREGLPLHLN